MINWEKLKKEESEGILKPNAKKYMKKLTFECNGMYRAG